MDNHSDRCPFRPFRSFAAMAVLLAVSGLHAGPLNPPAGPITPTGKTLTDVAPRTAISAANTPGDADSLFKITQPGSYYLTGNVTAVVGKHGIEIAASGVTLDLNGFDLIGIVGMGAFDGVNVSLASSTDIAVLNGSVRNWGDDGVDFGASSFGGRIEHIRVSGNADIGLRGVTNCTISHCSAYLNGTIGINSGINAVITDCGAFENGTLGISCGFGGTISSCSAQRNGTGGISISTGGTLARSTAYGNDGAGIIAANGSTIIDSTARFNGLDGIIVSSSCLVRGNSSSSNGINGDGAGVHATGIDNRIEDNNCTQNDRGILVDGAGNFIVRNTCSGNGINWQIAANNVSGPILDRTAPGTAAIAGSAAPDSTGSTHPNANFSY